MLYLRQSTASQSVLIGPFVDATDGVTAETGLTVANTDIRLSANGGNMFAKTSGGGTHDEEGFYSITLDATDTATVGHLQLSVQDAAHLPVYHEFTVLEEATYDFLFASGATPVADINAEVDTAFTTQMADSVATDGSIPTREQAIYMIAQYLFERVVSGTDVSVKKVDGTTELFGLALDDGTSPASITRDA